MQMSYDFMSIPLASCTQCGRWMRVLPLELLACKTYSLSAIEVMMHYYVHDPSASYRATVAKFAVTNSSSPSASSLYRWISGLGEKVLDRHQSIRNEYPPSSTAALAQSERILSSDVLHRYQHATVQVAPSKYRSENRHDQLLGVFKLLSVAASLFGLMYDSLQKWNNLLLPTLYVAVWDFPSGLRGTPMQQVHPP